MIYQFITNLSVCLSVSGLILRQEGNIQGSLEHFQQAVKVNPNNPSNVKQVARTL